MVSRRRGIPLFHIIGSMIFLVFSIGQSQAQVKVVPIDQKAQERLIAELKAKIDTIKGDPDKLTKLQEEGKDRTVLCRTCHGADGMAVRENVPNLAGQNPVYIVDQFQRFGDGRRFDYLMSGLAKTFSDEDKIKIALYFSSFKMRVSGGGKPGLLPEGKKIFTDICSECHGHDGHGQKGYARLAGQRYDYVLKMLKEFRDRTGRRINPWMTGVALKLNDRQMEAVATYVAQLN